ncbi:MAG: GNAT family N-acetyltransferase [Janthinobacterium lividum]
MAPQPWAAAVPQSVRVGVTVTFLRMDARPPPGPDLPADCTLVQLASCSVAFYRYLYDTVGNDHVWWLRRSLSPAALAAILAEDTVSVHVLYQGGEPAGFFELDRRARPVVNLSYFGLLPRSIGQGVGSAFLAAAIRAAWTPGTRSLTVNTCTADHPRALPGYQRAGFQVVRRVNEVWDVPIQLGLRIPPRLMV